MRTADTLRTLASIVSLLATLLIGCTATYANDPRPRADALPATAKRPLHAGIYYSFQFSAKEHTRLFSGSKTMIPIGVSSVRFLDEVFARAFEKTSRVTSLSADDLAAKGVDFVIAPSFEHFDFATGFDPESSRYSVHYRMTLYTIRGIPLASWVVAGDRPSKSSGLVAAIEEDMLDAGAKFLEGLDANAGSALAVIAKTKGLAPAPLDTRDVVLTGQRANLPNLSEAQEAALTGAGVVALEVTARSQTERALVLRASDMRIRLKDREILEPSTVSSVLSTLDQPSQSSAAAAALLGPIVGLLASYSEHRTGQTERESQVQAGTRSLFGARTLVKGKDETGIVLFTVPKGAAALEGAALTLWLVDPVAGAGSQTEIPFPGAPGCTLQALVGKWEGNLTFIKSGRERYIALTIAADGKWESVVPGFFNPGPNFYGTLTVSDGKCRWKSDTTGRTGTYVLRGSSGARVMISLDDEGLVRSELRPVK